MQVVYHVFEIAELGIGRPSDVLFYAGGLWEFFCHLGQKLPEVIDVILFFENRHGYAVVYQSKHVEQSCIQGVFFLDFIEVHTLLHHVHVVMAKVQVCTVSYFVQILILKEIDIFPVVFDV